ncbi:ArdC-like ssDNA-binding domain-containing protein [Salinirubrum litoreum]|uniref:ArdC-like ssDNA-binding domain-containing protein n=1 Tax=Salinirubrum litoreum TaxID=1126234 RepID=A0ABD5RB07_9EURY|nr:ArdC-like ssDNA-binding domain-containing protein [Salinirubrum litoreum]
MPTEKSAKQVGVPSDTDEFREHCRDRERRDDLLRETINRWIEELEQDVEEATASEQFAEWLDVQAQFHDYSFRNSILIRRQCPEATHVAGYRAWQDLDRQVQSGEQAIWIRAPIRARVCPTCDDSVQGHGDCDEQAPTEEWPQKVVGFRSVAVFDISQTEGEQLPELRREAHGNADWLVEALHQIADDWDIPVQIIDESEWPHGSAWGAYGTTEERIDLRNRENTADLARTFLHELAHARLHPEVPVDAQQAAAFELDAEATAAIVGRHSGLDTVGSRWYLSAWTHDENVSVTDRCEVIAVTARELIEQIDRKAND